MNLIKGFKKSNFRSLGKISVRHRNKGHKKKYRKIDFLKNIKNNMYGKVKNFFYDPNRNVQIALLYFKDGEKRFILKTLNMNINDEIVFTYFKMNFKEGSVTIIKNIDIGECICCVENKPGFGSIFSRSLGTFSNIIFKNNTHAIIKLSSGKKKKISINCFATIGKICNKGKKKKYKAGQNRWIGIRPTVRGVAMNPVDHPHGGGEGKTSGGRHPCSPKGIKSKGLKTVKNVKIN